MRAVLGLLALGLLAGCDLSGRVEREIEEGLPRALGPAAGYAVRVEGLRVRSGEADRVWIEGTDVRRAGAPEVERLTLTLAGVRYDRAARRLERVDRAEAVLRLRPSALAAFLEERDGVRQATVAVEPPDRARLRVAPDVAGVRLPPGVTAEVSGRLVAADGRLRFEVERVRAGGFGLGGGAARALSALLNPVLDETGGRPALHVTDARVEGDALVLEATGDLNGLVLR